METQILFCWLGVTDIKASEGEDVGNGPIAQAVQFGEYPEVILLNDWPEARSGEYVPWLQQYTTSKISLQAISLSGPTDFSEIYKAATQVVANKLREYEEDITPVFHLSPGTPAMAAIWILLAKTRFPAQLIESSRKGGVHPVSFPFDLSADYIPDLLRKPDLNLQRLAAGLPSESPEFDQIIHRSESMRRAVLQARRVAPRSVPVLIEGESGTGKELFARALHEASPRHGKPFVAINCGAIPPEIVESELFGHEKGAFTGAISERKGHFETAHNGTIFLDEIGELPKAMQVKLLRTIQEGEVQRIGASKPFRVNVRIIAATNRSLIEEVSRGSFREDLFYRLAVAVIRLPPLRERMGDINLLIDAFLKRINEESDNEPGYIHKKFSVSARKIMNSHQWPGNVRELQNTITRIAVWSLDEEINDQDVQDSLLPVPHSFGQGDILGKSLDNGINIIEIIDEISIHYLKRGMEYNKGNKTKTAKTLGFPNYQTLTNWLKKYKLE